MKKSFLISTMALLLTVAMTVPAFANVSSTTYSASGTTTSTTTMGTTGTTSQQSVGNPRIEISGSGSSTANTNSGINVTSTRTFSRTASPAGSSGTVLNTRFGKNEIHIFSGGRLLIRGVTVASLSGSVITAETSLGGYVIDWKLYTDPGTKFIDLGAGSNTLANIMVGDTLSFDGAIAVDKLSTDMGTSTVMSTGSVTNGSSATSSSGAIVALTVPVNATIVKDWSLKSGTRVGETGTISGTVSLINRPARTIVITTNGGRAVSVYLGGNDVAFQDGQTFDSLKIGQNLKIRGLWNGRLVINGQHVAIGTTGSTTEGLGGSLESTTFGTSTASTSKSMTNQTSYFNDAGQSVFYSRPSISYGFVNQNR